MRSIILLLCMIITGTQLFGCERQVREKNTPEHVFVYAENQAEDYPATRAAHYFSELVSEQTDGRIQIVVKSNGEMGDEASVVTQMQFGGIDFARVSLSSLADDISELNVLMMPYLYANEAVMWKVLEGHIGEYFEQTINENGKGLHFLSWFDAGARNFYSINPISSMEDLKNRRIRVQESDVMTDTIKALGANPVAMKYADVYQALQTGSIDGAENNWSSYEYSRHFELAGYCIVDEHTRIPEIQLISETAWNELTEAEREIISTCANKSAIYERNLWKQTENEARKHVEEAGVVITEISEDDLKQFQEAVQPLYDQYCSEYMNIIEEIRSIP